nr:inositol monophosphatase family protein [Gordonia jinhuaensis]
MTTIARGLAERAADHVRVRRRELFDRDSRGDTGEPTAAAELVATKSSPTDPVTVVDTETEGLIRGQLADLRPDDSVLGEEDGGSVEVPDGVRWVIDPIDGTVNFLYGVPAYAVSIAAQIDGVSVAGAVADVAGRRVFFATRGAGSFVADLGSTSARRLRASSADSVDLSLVATGFGYAAARRRRQGQIAAALLPRIRDLRRIGSAALDLCMVADGVVDAHFEHGLSPWDWAAGSLIAEEAGAMLRLPSAASRSDDGDLTLAAAPGIAEELTALLDELGALDPIPK